MTSSLVWSLAICCVQLASPAVSFIAPACSDCTTSALQGKHIKIDIAAVADHSLYSRFLEKARSYPGKDHPHVVQEELNLYMAGNIRAASNLFSHVTLGLNVTIELSVTSTKVIQKQEEVPNFSALKRADGTVDAREMLAVASAYKETIAMDVLIVFTGLNLGRKGNSAVQGVTQMSSVEGIAQLSAVCQPHAVAVVRFDNFHTQFHVAHELAHLFGATHDGPDCVGGAIMSRVSTDLKRTEDYRFSTCSQSAMAAHLEQASRKYASCLFESKPVHPGTPSLSEFPGSEISVDRQCQMVNGPLSYFCRGRMGGDQICQENVMPCTPMTNYTCTTIRVFPLPGTPCDIGKWCHEGKCVADPRTPKSECPYGDQSVRVDYDDVLESCETFIAKYPFYCYPFEAACCQTCSKLQTNNPACRYGNKMPSCQKSLCGTLFSDEPYDAMCCNTCKA